MSDPFIGEIKMVGYGWSPRGWAECNGQKLQITQYATLFSLLGTTFGGNGTTDFALPDFRGRSPIHAGTGTGLTPRHAGDKGGEAGHVLTTQEMPAHAHNPIKCSTIGSTQTSPAGADRTVGPEAASMITPYSDNAAAPEISSMSPDALTSAGSSQAHENSQPYLVVNFIIAMQGIYPSRP